MSSVKFAPSPEQQMVIDHRGGHLQVVACAGAGKTEAISRRVASLIAEGIEPCQIVAFTFTERAAESLETRITRKVAETKGEVFLDRLGPVLVAAAFSRDTYPTQRWKFLMDIERINYLAQESLGLILRKPIMPLIETVKQVLPEDAQQDLGTVSAAARSLLKDVLPTELAEGKGTEPTPILVDRLSFCWAILSEADNLIRKHRKDAPAPVPTTASLGMVFDGILPVKCLSVGFLRHSAVSWNSKSTAGFCPVMLSFSPPRSPRSWTSNWFPRPASQISRICAD